MTPLPRMKPSTPLVRADRLRLELGEDGSVYVDALGMPGPRIARGLELLAAFSRPTSIQEALDSVAVQGTQEWIEMTETLVRWVESGVLKEVGSPAVRAARAGYQAAPIHAVMLNDRARTRAFIDGIASAVRPGDVALDIGTGTGVLALAAARAGARRVYAIEATSMADVAEQNARANGMSDRITVIRGRSTDVNLPEKVDVIVTEMIGHHALGEGLIEVVNDAMSRFGHAGTRVVPEGVELIGIPLHIPEGDLAA